MATWDYGFYVTLNNLWGLSIISNPTEIISFILMSLCGIIGIFTLYQIYKKYKRTEDISNFIFYCTLF